MVRGEGTIGPHGGHRKLGSEEEGGSVRQRTNGSVAIFLMSTLVWTAANAAGSEGSGEAIRLPLPPVAHEDTREFHWTVRVPLVTLENREFVFRAPTAITRPQQWNYEGPAVRTERRRIATYPEFSCKYVGWMVSNECRTVWRGIYADLPVIVTRPQHLVFDMPDWRWKTQLVPIAVPRVTWKEEHWSVSVPVIIVDPADETRQPRADSEVAAEWERAHSALDAKRASALAALDDGLHALERSIAAVESEGVDPRRIDTGEGGVLDLVATRAALRDERADTVRRFRRAGGELDAAVGATPAAAE